jgi:hypothetical protein
LGDVVKTIIDNGLRKAMGQWWSQEWGNPYNMPVQTPSGVPGVPPPPEMSDESRVVDAATRSHILSIIGKAKALRNDVAAWWAANPNAQEILGKRTEEYQAFLAESMWFDDLAEKLQWRLAQSGTAYIRDSEIAAMEQYGKSSQELYNVVFGRAGDPGVASAPAKDLALPGIIAVGSLLVATVI